MDAIAQLKEEIQKLTERITALEAQMKDVENVLS